MKQKSFLFVPIQNKTVINYVKIIHVTNLVLLLIKDLT